MSEKNASRNVAARDPVEVLVGSGRDDRGTSTDTNSGSYSQATVVCASGNTEAVNPVVDPSNLLDASSLAQVGETFKLSRFQRLIAGSGHILNDLSASLWFTYFLLFMQSVVKFNDRYSSLLLLWGQIVDGVATPIVGYETDHVQHLFPCKKDYGRCKSWHLVGIIGVCISFPFIFSPCVGYSYFTDEWSRVADWKKAFYYVPFITIFQIGWACTQISHLALIPKLTPDDLVRTEILAIRYGCTVGANVSIFLMTWIFLTKMGAKASCTVSYEDASSFSYIAMIAVALGGIFSFMFHFFVIEKSDQFVKRTMSIIKIQESLTASQSDALATEARSELAEPSSVTTGPVRRLRRNRTPPGLRRGSGEGGQALLGSSTDEDDDDVRVEIKQPRRSSIMPAKTLSTAIGAGKENMTVLDWLKLPQFYAVAGLYLSTRLAVNLSQSYIPLYVQTTLGLNCGAVAYIPLVMYCSGFVISLIIKMLNKYLGRQISYGLGCCLILAASSFILFLDSAMSSKSWAIYVVAILLGGGSSAILVTSLSITADLIGTNIESGAFVYGAMSFCDKISCGLAIVLINNLNPCPDDVDSGCGSAKIFYKYALGASSGGAAVGGLFFTLMLTLLIFRKTRIASTSANSESSSGANAIS